MNSGAFFYKAFLFTDKLDLYFCKRYILNKLGNSYEEFFQHLGLTPAEIQVAQKNNNQDALGAMRELWNK